MWRLFPVGAAAQSCITVSQVQKPKGVCNSSLEMILTDLVTLARAMYTYSAAIPEELSFSKGDILAVLRLQDDGWWEAQIDQGRQGVGMVGLVPSNYLQQC